MLQAKLYVNVYGALCSIRVCYLQSKGLRRGAAPRWSLRTQNRQFFGVHERVNKRQASSVTTLTAHGRIAHHAPFVNGVTASSWWWHSRALDAALWPLGGWTPDRAVQPSPQRRYSAGQRGQVSSRRSRGRVHEQKPRSSPSQWDH